MIIFKFSEYLCLRICNVEDAKIIDWLYTCSNLIFQPEYNKHRTKTKHKKHTTQRRKIKTNRFVQRQRNHKNQQNKTESMWKSLRRKQLREGDFGSKLTLDQLSLIDQEEEKWWRLGFEKTIILISFIFIQLFNYTILCYSKHNVKFDRWIVGL